MKLMTKRLKKLFTPDYMFPDLLQVDFQTLADQGYKLILLDIDNTLALHGASVADDYARQVIGRVQEAGLVCQIITNAMWKRARQYAAGLDVSVRAQAGKPSTYGIRKACLAAGIAPEQCVMIGDQLLTDVLAARRAGCLAILVRPRTTKEPWTIRARRKLENFFWGRRDHLD
jgi:HAD superfamily phosphatase (TIGR01668 family)